MEKRAIHYDKSETGAGAIAHELIHAHCWRSIRDAGGMGADDVEEIMCRSLDRQWQRFIYNYTKICIAFRVIPFSKELRALLR